MMKSKPTSTLAFAFTALILLGQGAALAQAKDPKLVTCAELLAMEAKEQMAFVQSLVAASANALDLNDLVADSAIGPVIEVCQGNPEMMAMDAAKKVGN